MIIAQLNEAVFQVSAYERSVKYTIVGIIATTIFEIIQIILIYVLARPTLEDGYMDFDDKSDITYKYCKVSQFSYIFWPLMLLPILVAFTYICYLEWKTYKDSIQVPYMTHYRVIVMTILLMFMIVITIQANIFSRKIHILLMLRHILLFLGWCMYLYICIYNPFQFLTIFYSRYLGFVLLYSV